MTGVLEPLVRPIVPAALVAWNYRVPIARIANIVIAGAEPQALDLPHRLFRDRPKPQPLATVPIWQLRASLERMDADLTIARLDRLSARLFYRRDAIHVPEWISAVLTVPDDLHALARANHSMRNDMRKAQHHGFEAAVTHDRAAFDAFYDSMYVPFTRGRHEAKAFVYDRGALLRRFHRGGILWIRAKGENVAGVLFEHRHPTMRSWALGTRNGDVELERSGVIFALYFHTIAYARQQGVARVDFGGTHACLNDGLLRYKRGWGMRFGPKSDNYYHSIVHWRRWTPAVAAFLAEVPVIHERSGRLRGITALNTGRAGSAADLKAVQHSLWTTGLERLTIVSSNGWEPGLAPGPSTVLLHGEPSAAQLASNE